MLDVFLQTLPFFAVIGTGFLAAWFKAFPPQATQWLTRFVFFFALSAMLFHMTATRPLASLWQPQFLAAYLSAALGLYALGFILSRLRGATAPEAAIEAQCGVVGNTAFLGLPMLTLLLGPQASGALLLIVILDLIVFSSLVTLVIAAAGAGGKRWFIAIYHSFLGLLGNPMVTAVFAGMLWSGLGLGMPAPLDQALLLLGGAATPCALFAIGASLAERRAERLGVATWLSSVKLIAHPAITAISALWIFDLPPVAAQAMIAAAALPVAGNIFILAQYYGVGALRVSTAILISTVASVVTLPLVITLFASL